MDENLILKMNILGGMDSYARENFNEYVFDEWLVYGVPDGCDEDTLREIAEDDALFREICDEFGRLLNENE